MPIETKDQVTQEENKESTESIIGDMFLKNLEQLSPEEASKVVDDLDNLSEKLAVTTENNAKTISELRNNLMEVNNNFINAINSLQEKLEMFREGKISVPERDWLGELKSMEGTILKAIMEGSLSESTKARTLETFNSAKEELENKKYETNTIISPVASAILENKNENDDKE